jgi:hypothetical protein
MPSNNVLLPLAFPTQKALRAAVAEIIREIQREHRETDQCTADRIGVSIGTIRNARNEETDLNALTIAKIGMVYGCHAVDPYNALYGATASPRTPDDTDPLAHMAHAVATLCDMRRADSPGGKSETPKERLDALPVLREARRSHDAHIAGIEKLRAVA